MQYLKYEDPEPDGKGKCDFGCRFWSEPTNYCGLGEGCIEGKDLCPYSNQDKEKNEKEKD